ncbi:MAG TPA: ABC transporter permease [Micromonosporaceae bacterium]|nr:ABC transporter permease [Micromonosporaceae bacterium]
MNPTTQAVRTGVRRGLTEFRHSMSGAESYSFTVFLAVIILTVLYLLRGHTIPGTSLSLATVALPGVVGMLVAFNTTLNAAFTVAIEREDGTLLRARAAPYGVVSYVAGQVVRVPLTTVVSLVIVMVPGFLLFHLPDHASAGGWLTFAWVLVLGLAATLPFGLAIGALAGDPRSPAQSVGLVSIVLVGISGIFYPVTAMPGWLHPIAQVFPYYWLGTGMRSAFLPPSAAAVELSGSWQHWQTAAVLGAWAVVGLLLAPVALRNAAREESGASVSARRDRAMQRLG